MPEEANAIKKIPLSQVVVEDSLSWPMEQDGKYICKSGYRFLKEEAALNIIKEPIGLEKDLWKEIQALEYPNKVKNLIWTACINSLPTKGNLVRRTIISYPTCDQCIATTENPLYAFWSCSELDIIWTAEKVLDFQSQVYFQDFKALTTWILKKNKASELFATTVLFIQNQRNHVHLH